ncbi:hypothetical protein O181_027567 [Austropuccinia psidii MF-1]|uniref:Uncharacterized protein n=1 Tax=Austropuccinia psidii MF-1 TaxID=1389203 RepID=A0A9Q3CQ94_9BASI|nr:hypothetical protein [Austropuccinia psidii MF-1]
MSSYSLRAHSKSINSDRNEIVDLMTLNSPTTPNFPLTTPMESSMNVFSLHIDQAVPMPPPPFINVPGISVSSIANPTGSQCGNEYPPYPRDYLLNPSSTRS